MTVGLVESEHRISRGLTGKTKVGGRGLLKTCVVGRTTNF